MSLFDLSMCAIALPHDSSGWEIPISSDAYVYVNNRRLALAAARYRATVWMNTPYCQLDMYDDDGEAYLTHDRTLWWAGAVYTNERGALWTHPKSSGFVMAIVKQDHAVVDWDWDAMQHCPDALSGEGRNWRSFTEWGHAVESVKPGWWEGSVLGDEITTDN